MWRALPGLVVFLSLVIAATPLIGALAAGLRHSVGLSPGLALTLATISGVSGGWWASASARRSCRWPDAAFMTGALVFSALLVRAAAAAEGFEGTPTIGGGDAGNHLALAGAWATDLPRIYAGFGALYALLYAVDHSLRDDLLRSLHDVHRLGLLSAVFFAFTICWRTLREMTRRQALWALVVAGVCGVYIWPNTSGLLAHYLQVDGFYPHSLALAPLMAICATVVWIPSGHTLGVALLLGLATLRFTYGLQLADAALGAAALLWWSERDTPRRGLWRGVAVGLLVAAAVVWWQLWIRRDKAGGVQRFDPHTITLAMGALSALAAPLMWRDERRPHLRRLGVWALSLSLPSLVIAALTWSVPDVKRGYYLWKYPLTPLIALGLSAPALALGALQRLWRPWPRYGPVVTTALAAIAVAGALQTPDANVTVAETWRERLGQDVERRRLQPLVDRHLLAFTRRELRTSEPPRRLLALAHDQWALYNATWSLLHSWQMPPIERAVELQMGRFPAFQRGAPLKAGGCVVWSETPARRQSVLRRADTQRSPLGRRLRRWRADPNRRCEAYTPHWAQAIWPPRHHHDQHAGHDHSRGPHLPLAEVFCVLCR